MFNLFIVTLEKTRFDGQVHSVVLPGVDGYFQVLSNHAPLVALLRSGRLEIEEQEGIKEIYALSGGFFEVAYNKATVIADALEKASEIDYERALHSLLRAQKRLASSDGEVDRERAKLSMERAENRIKIHRQLAAV